MKVQVVNKSGFPLPEYQTEGSVGFDLQSIEDCELAPQERKLVPTGIYISIPKGFEGQIRPRSGLSISFGLTVLNTPGTIDSDYRGEIKIILYNAGLGFIYITKGDRIAQLVISPIQKVELIEVEELDKTTRGEDGFGSTGINDELISDALELIDIYGNVTFIDDGQEQENI